MHYKIKIAGNIFTHWYTWKATSMKTEKISIRGYCWMKWTGDFFLILYAFDPTLYIAQME